MGALVDVLEDRGELDNTLVLYLGDNGFLFGEHGLIDKRCAYEESIRIPMIARWPGVLGQGIKVNNLVANLDVAPSLLAAAGVEVPKIMDGRDVLPLVRGKVSGKELPWRRELLYEYYWERNYPQTPTVHALRGERFKYIRYHGVWDLSLIHI